MLDRYSRINLGLVVEMRECWGQLAECLRDRAGTPGSGLSGTQSLSLDGYAAERASIGHRMIEAVLHRLKREQLPARFLADLRNHSERILGLWSAASSFSEASPDTADGSVSETAVQRKRPPRVQALLASEMAHSRKRRGDSPKSSSPRHSMR